MIELQPCDLTFECKDSKNFITNQELISVDTELDTEFITEADSTSKEKTNK